MGMVWQGGAWWGMVWKVVFQSSAKFCTRASPPSDLPNQLNELDGKEWRAPGCSWTHSRSGLVFSLLSASKQTQLNMHSAPGWLLNRTLSCIMAHLGGGPCQVCSKILRVQVQHCNLFCARHSIEQKRNLQRNVWHADIKQH